MKDTGGPAFARDSYKDREAGLIVTQNGMTLRDYMAAAALTGLCMAHDRDMGLNRGILLEGYAEASYAIADAMIAERGKA